MFFTPTNGSLKNHSLKRFFVEPKMVLLWHCCKLVPLESLFLRVNKKKFNFLRPWPVAVCSTINVGPKQDAYS